MTRLRALPWLRQRIPLCLKLRVASVVSSTPVTLLVDRIFRTRVWTRAGWISVLPGEMSPRVKAMLLFNLYEAAELRAIRRFLPVEATVVELGANRGIVSSAIIGRRSTGALVCVEANSELSQSWRRAVGNAPNVDLVAAAIVEDENSPVFLHISEDGLASRVELEHTCVPRPPSVVRVEGVRLSSLLQRFRIDRYFLVSDIEGGEIAFILGSDRRALDLCDGMIIELHDVVTADRLVKWAELKEALEYVHGFEVHHADGPVVVFRRRTIEG